MNATIAVLPGDGIGVEVTNQGAKILRQVGEVFGHRNLFVMDGSVIPRAIGRNPSKTIAAVAERSCERLLGELSIRLNGATTL